MNLDRRLAGLRHLYAVYDRFCQTIGDLACRKYCDDCCSRNVTMTTLEGLHLLNGLPSGEKAQCLDALAGPDAGGGFRPRWTTNQMAAFCREGREPPEDAAIPDPSRCPLLADRACSLYGSRPFGCRAMVSRNPCRKRGFADMDEWVLTVNTVFLQLIEHLDRPGCFGNMRDVVLALTPAERLKAYEDGRPPVEAPGLIPNHPAPVLLVPPEHQTRLQPILAEIQQGLAPAL